MNLTNLSYAPEIFTRLIKEGLEIYKQLGCIEIDKEVLTLGEIREDMCYWKERMSLFYNLLGWDSNLIKILDS